MTVAPAVAGLVVLLLAGGCRVDATVETRVEGRSGEVRARFVLDREAVELLGGIPAVDAGAQVTDLRRAGWVISPVRRRPSGGAEVEAAKRFNRPDELSRVMDELSGPGGPLRDFRLERRRSLTAARYRLTGRADLEAGAAVAAFGNVPDLPGRLRDAGVDPNRVEELVTSRAADGFHLRVVVDLPGEEPAVWDVPAGQPVEIEVASTAPDRVRVVLLGLAAASGVAAVVVMKGNLGRLARRPLWRRHGR